MAAVALLAWGRRGLGSLLRKPPPPLAFLAAFAGAHLLSVAFASWHQDLSLKFAVRMAVAAAFGAVVGLCPREAQRAGIGAMAVASSVVAALALLEGAGARTIDPLLGLFRETPVLVGGIRRATAGSESPNLAAAFLMCGLVGGVGLLPSGRGGRRAAAAFTLFLGSGLLFTYARGAVAASAAGLVTLMAAAARFDPPRVAAPAVALVTLLGAATVFGAAAPGFRLRLAGADVESWYRARYEPADTSLSMGPGEAREVSVRVTNVGRASWTGDGSFRLACHWYDPEAKRNVSDSILVPVRREVPPGGEIVLRAALRSPEREGRYVLGWEIHHIHVGWFSSLGVTPALVAVSVSQTGPGGLPDPFPSSIPLAEVTWVPPRADLWRLALAMWRDHPWTGVGSDNFRRLYGTYAGRGHWDPRTFANNTFLEVAATTGTSGALALLATLASAAWAAFRRLSASPAGSTEANLAGVLLALVTTMAVHGLIDYVLAFTGHYLLFAFVVGAASSSRERA